MQKNLFILISLFFFFGCSHVSIQHDEATLANFAGKKTFAWLTEAVPSDDVRVNNPTVKKLVESSVERELINKGYTLAAAKDADFLVSWFGNVDEIVKEVHISAFYRTTGYATLLGSQPNTIEGGKAKQVFTSGTLILDLIDGQSKNVFWRETATNAITKKMSPGELKNYINTSVVKALEKVPTADH